MITLQDPSTIIRRWRSRPPKRKRTIHTKRRHLNVLKCKIVILSFRLFSLVNKKKLCLTNTQMQGSRCMC